MTTETSPLPNRRELVRGALERLKQTADESLDVLANDDAMQAYRKERGIGEIESRLNAVRRAAGVERDADKLVNDGLSLLRDVYWKHVRSLAEDIKSAADDKEFTDRDGLNERIDETADGDQWVIYTQKAQLVMLLSENDSAYAEVHGDAEGMVVDGSIAWSVLAYFALRADLVAHLDAVGIDVNDWDPSDEEDEEDPDDDAENTEDADETADGEDTAV